MNKILKVGCYDTDVFDFDSEFKPKRHEEFTVYKLDDLDGYRYVLNTKNGYWEISRYEFDWGFYVVDEKPFITYLEEYKSKRKRKVEASWHRTPQSNREAEEWAKKHLNIGHVDFTGFDLKLAQDIVFQLWKLQRFYPEIPTIKWLSTSNILHRANFEHNLLDGQTHFYKCREKRKSLTWAWSFSEKWGKQQGIAFNAKYAKDYEDLRKRTIHSAKTGYHPSNCSDVSHIVSHEFAHQIDNFLRLEGLRDECIEPLWQKYKEKAETLLSQYATTNSKEFFAEAFAEFIHVDYDENGNYKCSSIALEVADSLDKALRIYRERNGLGCDWARESRLPQFV